MMKTKMAYCLHCGRMVSLYPKHDIDWHYMDMSNEDELKYGPKHCYGPFTSSTPPKMPWNWNEIVQEPSVEELAIMNENVNSLMFDLNLL